MIMLTGCANKIIFSEIDEVKYIKDNKDNINSVIFSRVSLGGQECFLVDIKEAYDLFTNVEYAKESNISVTDDYISYTFIFNDGTKKVFNFENKYFEYKNNNYTLDNFSHISTSSEELIECETTK